MKVGDVVMVKAIVGGTGPGEEDLSLLGRRGTITGVWETVSGRCYAVSLHDFGGYPGLSFLGQELRLVPDERAGDGGR